jgi:DNA-binding transcriptional ArsR family regulator
MTTPPLTVKVLDGDALKALAHPLRMRLLAALRYHGPATATMLGERLGESSGSTSYHLRVLAEHGFIEEVPGHAGGRGRGRERWWRAAHDMTSWASGGFRDDPDEKAAEDWLAGYVGRAAVELIDDFLARRDSLTPEWLGVSDQSDYQLTMTPEQASALLADIHTVVARHRAEVIEALQADLEAAARARPVGMLVYALPGEGTTVDDREAAEERR